MISVSRLTAGVSAGISMVILKLVTPRGIGQPVCVFLQSSNLRFKLMGPIGPRVTFRIMIPPATATTVSQCECHTEKFTSKAVYV